MKDLNSVNRNNTRNLSNIVSNLTKDIFILFKCQQCSSALLALEYHVLQSKLTGLLLETGLNKYNRLSNANTIMYCDFICFYELRLLNPHLLIIIIII